MSSKNLVNKEEIKERQKKKTITKILYKNIKRILIFILNYLNHFITIFGLKRCT